MARTGKIARLSYEVRETVNEEIRNGTPGVEIIAWLNRLSHVQEVLRDHFDGKPINDQNLTEWKAGGYQDWLRHLETQDTVKEWIGRANGLESLAGEWGSVADALSASLAIQIQRCLDEITQATDLTPVERSKAVIALGKASSQLRRTNQSGIRLAAEQERKVEQQEAARQRALAKQAQQQQTQALQAMLLETEERVRKNGETLRRMEDQFRTEEAERRNPRPAPAAAPEHSLPSPEPRHPPILSTRITPPAPPHGMDGFSHAGFTLSATPGNTPDASGQFRVIQANSNQIQPV